mmetsp:Transcript_24044/g.24631  ORF Transcript_24044/g.24631 Transcript_24044/m.24631 type:complete len:234 (-) Transcript_24044:147-848(-)
MSGTGGTTNEVPPWLSENNVKAIAVAAQSPVVQQATVNAINNGGISSVVNVIGSAIGLNTNQFTRLEGDSTHGSTDGSVTSEIDPKELAEIEIWIEKLRSAYTTVGVLMLLAAFFSLGTNNLATLFLAIYVWFFGLLILCVEIALKIVAKVISENFGFMYNPVMRFLFIFLNMVLCYELGLIGKIVVCLLAVTGCTHIYVAWKHPQFEHVLRKKHFYGDSNSSSSNNNGSGTV